METNRARTIACLAAALLVGSAVVGCGGHGATPQSTVPGPSYSTAESPSGSAESVGSGDLTGSAPDASSGAGSSTAPPTPDPVASELDQINQLINDINNSVGSSDSSQQGGE